MTADAVLVAEFQKNRNGAAIRVSLRRVEQLAFVDIQEWRPVPGDKLAPTAKTVTFGVHLLGDLATAIEKATKLAREWGVT